MKGPTDAELKDWFKLTRVPRGVRRRQLVSIARYRTIIIPGHEIAELKSWFDRRLETFGGASPRELWEAGRGEEVIEVMTNLINGDVRG